MPAAMVHGGCGVLLMTTTKFASQQTIKIHKITKPMQSKPSPSQPYPTQNNKTKIQAKSTMPTNILLHQTKLPLRYSFSK